MMSVKDFATQLLINFKLWLAVFSDEILNWWIAEIGMQVCLGDSEKSYDKFN